MGDGFTVPLSVWPSGFAMDWDWIAEDRATPDLPQALCVIHTHTQTPVLWEEEPFPVPCTYPLQTHTYTHSLTLLT